jgi:hypothetical protein
MSISYLIVRFTDQSCNQSITGRYRIQHRVVVPRPVELIKERKKEKTFIFSITAVNTVTYVYTRNGGLKNHRRTAEKQFSLFLALEYGLLVFRSPRECR